MKILMTTDCVGGVWTYAMELCRALGAMDVQVVLATMGPRPTAAQRDEARAVPHILLTESQYRLEWQEDPWSDVRDAGDWLLALAQQHRPDVVHLNGYVHAALDWPAPVVVVAHSCVLSWWRAVLHEDAPADWSRYERMVRGGLRAADAVIAPTQVMLSCLQHHYGFLPRARVIHNARDPALFQPAHKQPLIFSAGRLWDPAKNLQTLIAAAPKIPWPIRVAGDTRAPDGGTIDTGGVCAMGVLSTVEIADQLGRAMFYVLPARYEPFGLSILEAALAGCTLILGDIPSLREVWADAAIYVSPDAPGALADAVNDLIAHPPQRKALAEAARVRAAMYTPGRMAGQYLDLYRALAATPALDRVAPAYVGTTVNINVA